MYNNIKNIIHNYIMYQPLPSYATPEQKAKHSRMNRIQWRYLTNVKIIINKYLENSENLLNFFTELKTMTENEIAIYVEEELIQKDNWLQLDKGNVVTINGLDGYALPKLIDRFEYARPKQKSKSKLRNGA